MTPLSLHPTSQLILRSWRTEDALDLFDMVEKNRARLSPWLPWVPGVKTIKDSLAFITSSIDETAKDTGLELGIFFDESLAGCIGLHELDFVNQRTSIGYWLDGAYEGKGIMTHSVSALSDYCFESLKLHRIEIRCAVDNAKSIAIPSRVGFTREGILRQAEYVDGKYLDDVVFSLLESDQIL